MTTAEATARAQATFTRRFGHSMLPLYVRLIECAGQETRIRVQDRESGSWAEYLYQGRRRLVRVAEWDFADNNPDFPKPHKMS